MITTKKAVHNKGDRKKKAKEVIIEEATNLFYEFGYEGTSIRDVVGKLNIPHPSIYYYFKNKEHLLFEVIESSGLEVITELEKAINYVEEPLSKLANMVYRHLVTVINKKRKHKVFMEDGYNLRGKLADRLMFLNQKIYNLYYYQVKILGERGLLKSREYPVITFMILGIINWTYRWFKEDGRLSIEELAYVVINSIFYGVIPGETKPLNLLSIKVE